MSSKTGKRHFGVGGFLFFTSIAFVMLTFLWWIWVEGTAYFDLYAGKTPMVDLRVELRIEGKTVTIRRRIGAVTLNRDRRREASESFLVS